MKNNNKKGFTLVELVIVVAVMAILVAVAIPAVSTITDTASAQVNASNCRTIESLIKLAEAEAEAKNGTVDYETKLEEAKLGIETGTYYYDDATGKVTLGGTAPAKGLEIVFAKPKAAVGETPAVEAVTVTTLPKKAS